MVGFGRRIVGSLELLALLANERAPRAEGSRERRSEGSLPQIPDRTLLHPRLPLLELLGGQGGFFGLFLFGSILLPLLLLGSSKLLLCDTLPLGDFRLLLWGRRLLCGLLHGTLDRAAWLADGLPGTSSAVEESRSVGECADGEGKGCLRGCSGRETRVERSAQGGRDLAAEHYR